VTSREDIAKRVRETTDGKGVPVVYTSVGKDTRRPRSTTCSRVARW
jgi:NADPH:quinone reductase-like Zn-dependent oxidoreductase